MSWGQDRPEGLTSHIMGNDMEQAMQQVNNVISVNEAVKEGPDEIDQELMEDCRLIEIPGEGNKRINAAVHHAPIRNIRGMLIDVGVILFVGTVLGLVYNFTNPSGISVIPRIWLHPSSPKIDITATKALLDAGTIILVDARPATFHKQLHIRDALNLPPALFDFVYMMRFSRIDPRTPVVVYGRNISRLYDEEIAYQLTQRGHTNVFVLNGGFTAWRAKGFEVSP